METIFQRTGAIEEHRKMRNYLRRMEHEGVQRVKMFLVITSAYVLFWGPLFFVTLVHHPAIGNPTGYEVIRTYRVLRWGNGKFVSVFVLMLLPRNLDTIDIYVPTNISRSLLILLVMAHLCAALAITVRILIAQHTNACYTLADRTLSL